MFFYLRVYYDTNVNRRAAVEESCGECSPAAYASDAMGGTSALHHPRQVPPFNHFSISDVADN